MIEFNPTEKTCVFIDGSNVSASAKLLGFDIDYSRLLSYFRTSCHLLRINYYTAVLSGDDYCPVRRLVDWLSYNGFNVVTKAAREINEGGKKKIKGNMDIDLAVDAMVMAKTCDHIVIFSGDGDFRRLIDEVQHMGCRVTVVSTNKSSPPMVSDELRRQADSFVDLVQLQGVIARDTSKDSSADVAK